MEVGQGPIGGCSAIGKKNQKALFGNAILTALMSGRKYDVIPQNGNCSRESNVRNSVFSNQSPLSKRNVVTELNTWKSSTFR
jgi:hypothetical protein